MSKAQRTDGKRQDWTQTIHGEPGLDELLADPCLHLLLRADRVDRGELGALIARTRWRLRVGVCHAA